MNETGIICQQALERVLTYLQDDGVELTTDVCRRAFRLVETVMGRGAVPDLPARCIAAVPEYFDRPPMSYPVAHPPLNRGHIGYE